MKNIHVLPTDKPSAIGYHFDIVKTGSLDFAPNFGFKKFDVKNNFQHRPHNICITNDEEIKDGDWCYYENGNLKGIHKVVNGQRPKTMFLKKIILTTDQDLIKDGVQAIPDEFLEWFVKNPSCEEIGIERWTDYKLKDNEEVIFFNYKIIIPKEEPKLRCKDCNDILAVCTCTEDTIDMKQETLEGFINSQPYYGSCTTEYLEGIEVGAKWQQEQQMFSWDDLQEAYAMGRTGKLIGDFNKKFYWSRKTQDNE